MVFLNEHEGLNLTHQTLMQLGAKVGMDVPFFVSGHEVALGTHFGECISPLPELPKNLSIKIHEGSKISTPQAYKKWDEHGKPTNKTAQPLIEALKKKDSSALLKSLHNDFQTIYPLPEFFQPDEHAVSLLSGSGGAFAVFRETDTHK